MNKQGGIIQANEKIAFYLNEPPSELQDHTLFELAPHLNLISWKKIWGQLSETGAYRLETEFLSSGDVLFPVCLHLSVLKNGNDTIALAFVEDLYEHMRFEAAGQKLLLSKLTLDTTTDLIFWVSSQGKVFFANDAAYKLLGYEPKTLAGIKFSGLLTSPDFTGDSLPGQPTFEAAFGKRKGGELLVEINWNTVSLNGQEYVCFIARDITERKKKEKELEEANQVVAELSGHLQEENLTLREEVFSNYNFNNIITCSKSYRKVLNQVAQVADTGATVLITGETGTGKELLARAIYSLSDRESGPFVKVNCAALPPGLIESELFGHEKGAFTGAFQQRKGRFEIANKGTIFLDEIGEMPLPLQPKLLRVLQEGEFERVGGTKAIKVDVRVIAATNRELEKMVEKGEFREDLFYRLNVFPIYNIPLRNRPEDIPVLIRHFVKKHCKQIGKTIGKIAQADIDLLMQYDFPGNVRELENLIERAVILTKGNKLNIRDSFVPSPKNNKPLNKDFRSFEDMQRQHIVKALEQTKWRITGPKGAARLLGLKDRTLMSKMRKLGINREDYV